MQQINIFETCAIFDAIALGNIAKSIACSVTEVLCLSVTQVLEVKSEEFVYEGYAYCPSTNPCSTVG